MTGSTTGIIVIVVVVVCLAVWLGSVALAARRPGREHPQHDPMRGLVQGGQHVGGGRSVAPHRDKLVPEGGGDPPEQDLYERGRRTPTRAPRAVVRRS